jgi:hypothetical protein
MKMNNFFTANQLAEYFGGNPKTICRRLRAKQIPAFEVRKTEDYKNAIKWLR